VKIPKLRSSYLTELSKGAVLGMLQETTENKEMRQNVTNLKSRAYLDNTPAFKPESAQCVRNKKRSLLFTFLCIHGIYFICLDKFHE